MKKLFARFKQDESGATAIEYGLIAALISVALIAGASTLGESLNETFTGLTEVLDANQPGGTPAPAPGG